MATLVLAAEPPLPPRSGLPLRIVHLARALARDCDLELAAIAPGSAPAQAAQEPFALSHFPGDWSRRRAVARAAAEPWPVAQVRSRALAEHVAAGRWDVVQAHGLAAVRFLPRGIPSVYDAADVLADVTRGMAGVDSRRAMRPLWQFESVKARAFERMLARKVSAVSVTNEEEGETFERLGARRVVVVPNGIDTGAIPFRPPKPGTELVFVGYFAWRPNVEAALELVDEIVPRVRSRMQSAKLTLVGAGAPPVLCGRAGPAVRLTGGVDDTLAELRRARVTIIPLRAGGGTRIKVLEAFAAGIPVVATRFAVAGLEVRDGVHALLAESPAELAELAVRVIENDELAGELARAARELVESRYDWGVVARPLLELHRDLRDRSGAL